MLSAREGWTGAFPGAAVGVLAIGGVANPTEHAGLERRKQALEEALRLRYQGQDRADLRKVPIIQAYDAYYRRFKKTYHVLLQLESIAFKGKSIARGAALVEVMFMAELKNLLLTAGHDLGAIRPPVTVDVAAGDEVYTGISGREQRLKEGDMFIADAEGVISSIIYGPDRRTRIREETEEVLFTTYAPPGIGQEAVSMHLDDLRQNVMVIAPEAEVMWQGVIAAGE